MCKKKFAPEQACLIQQLLSHLLCAVTLDLWTSRHMLHGYFGVTVHFVNDEWKMKSYLLGCKHILTLPIKLLI